MEINFACDLIIESMSVQFEKSKETDFIETENQDQKKVNLNDLVSRMNFEKKKERKKKEEHDTQSFCYLLLFVGQ